MKNAFRYDYVKVKPDQQIGQNSHPQWELSHVINGGGTRTICSHSEPIREGEVILIPPDVPHQWLFDPEETDREGNISNISIFFDASLPESLAQLLPELQESVGWLCQLRVAVSYTGALRERIAALMQGMEGLDATVRLPEMIRLLTLLPSEGDRVEAGGGAVQSRQTQRMERVRIFCACNHQREVSLDEIALHVGMNKSAFCKFMRQQTGMTFTEYMNDHRLTLAKERISTTDEPIASIAYSSGFANVTYFNRLFRARYGCTPGSVRRG